MLSVLLSTNVKVLELKYDNIFSWSLKGEGVVLYLEGIRYFLKSRIAFGPIHT